MRLKHRTKETEKAKPPRMEPLAEYILTSNNGSYRKWVQLSDNDLVNHAKSFIELNEIKYRKELSIQDPGLYGILLKRKLIGEIGLENHRRDWRLWGTKRLISYARSFINENGIDGRGALCKADSGLYEVLRERGLLGKVSLNEKERKWEMIGDEDLLAYAKKFIAEMNIIGTSELRTADSGLDSVLRKRGLKGEIGLKSYRKKRRNWSLLEDDEIVASAKELIMSKGIRRRIDFQKADKAMYQEVNSRKLLDAVFSDTESSKHKEAVVGVLEALGSFGDDK